MIKVIKKDGTVEPFDMEKIFKAIDKASQRANCNIRRGDHELLESYITFECESKGKDIPTSEMHSIVIKALYACSAYKEINQNPLPEANMLWLLRNEADSFQKHLAELTPSMPHELVQWLRDCYKRKWRKD